MSSSDYLLFFFCLTIISFETSMQMDKLCDRSASLVFDSAVSFERESNTTFWLFSGKELYESKPMDSDSDERPKFVKKNVIDINQNISPPIDVSFYTNRDNRIRLANYQDLKLWVLDISVFPDPVLSWSNLSSAPSGIDMMYWQREPYQVFTNQTSISFLDNYTEKKRYYLQFSANKTLLKLIQSNDTINGFESKLKGHPITAAFDRRLNNKTFVYLFAGRMLCRQELSEKFVKVCDIEDIADWIDCKYILTKPEKSYLLLLIIGLTLGVVVILIVVLVLAVSLFKRKNDKQNEDSTLKFLDNESTANLKSDIPSPKPSESYEGLMANKSKTTVKKKTDNSKSDSSTTL